MWDNVVGNEEGVRSEGMSTAEPVAIIDIGSNSARVVAYVADPAGRLRILASSRAALRLVEEVDGRGRLGVPAIARAIDALRDFGAIARGVGARRVVAVATAAMRDAADAPAFLERARSELGIEIKVVGGEAEGRYGFVGGIRGLPVESGLLFDMGGGSLQLSRFANRRLVAATSLPLGALRLSVAFLKTDPPRHRQVRDVHDHVSEVLETAGIAPLARHEVLVGVGGTIRNLAKIDRQRRRYPIVRVHGYSLKRHRVTRIASLLAKLRFGNRAHLPGLSGERADSIVAGAFAVDALMRTVRADRVLVSGSGVREGIAYSLWSESVPTIGAMQEASVASLLSRFWGVNPKRAARRAGLAESLQRALEPDAPGDVREALVFAARLVDIGTSVDFFDRHKHAADMVLETELDGFSHRQIAMISAVIRCARKEQKGDAQRYATLLHARDWGAVRRSSLVLALAEDIEERLPEGASAELDCHVSKHEIRVTVPALPGWRPWGSRFEATFGRRLVVKGAFQDGASKR